MTTQSGEPRYTSLTVAQFRLLQRLKRGLFAPVSRYHTGTIEALYRKNCVSRSLDLTRSDVEVAWVPTTFGENVLAAKGKLLPLPPVEEDVTIERLSSY
jgi:hypothetical protein